MRMLQSIFSIVIGGGALIAAFWILSVWHTLDYLDQSIIYKLSDRADFFIKPEQSADRKLPLLAAYTLSDAKCARLLNDPQYAKSPENKKLIVKVDDTWDELLDSSCNSIRSRGHYPLWPSSRSEQQFPIAFARIVYKDYHLQELLLNLIYAPQNYYCFALDAKSSQLFKKQMRSLSKCFANVFVARRQFTVDSAGHNMSASFMECLRLLSAKANWKYAILLQNNDIPLKTNYEITQILRALNGSNDINVGLPNRERIPSGLSWTFKALELFQDESANDDRVLRIAKGSTSASLSRAFVEFVVDKLNLTTVIERFERIQYGVDEMLFASLHSEDALDAPGGFTRQCIGVYNNLITRYVSWKESSRKCESGQFRHKICVLGIADLWTLRESRALFANKMLAESDYTAIGCWANAISNRTFATGADGGGRWIRTALAYYTSRLPVRFNNERHRWRRNLSAFDCLCC